MGRQVDGDPRRPRGGLPGGLTDRPPPAFDAPPPPPPSLPIPMPRQARGSAKMKMASLIAAADSAEPLPPGSDADRARRKRVRKTRPEGDWRAAMPPAVILNPAPSDPLQFRDQPLASASSTAAASVFHEMPAIQSFAETERRRAAFDGPGAGAITPSVMAPQAIVDPSRSASAGQAEVLNGAALPAASRTGPVALAGGLSLFEVYFPYARIGGQETNGAAGSGRSLKRKRRGEAASGRPSRRAGKDDDASGVSKYDLLRFDVDSVKLVPQGLVDRVEPKMSSAFLAKVIRSHVDNWCRRSGFGSNFVAEATTLLTAYYPCNYPTLLDEVLAGFLFTCPEYVDKFLPAMIAKYHKAAESVTSAKHPVIDALARQCRPVRGSFATRHDLSCLTLLRCLVEKNTEKFLLSPSIAVCAVECSDAALGRCWLALLSAMRMEGVTGESDAWDVYEPSHQAYELLVLDDKLRSRHAPDSRRISESFVRAVLFNPPARAHVTAAYPDLLHLALGSIFADERTAWTAALFNDWVAESAREEGDAPAFPLEDLIKLVLECCATVSIQKTNWFANHVLRFVLSEQYPSQHRERALDAIVQRHMALLLGAASTEDTKFVAQVFRSQSANSAGDKASNGQVVPQEAVKTPTTPVVHVEQLEHLLSLLASSDEKSVAMFLKLWTTAWTTDSTTAGEPLTWSYIRALVLILVRRSSNHESSGSCQAFDSLVCDVAERASSSFFQRLQAATKSEKRTLPQVSTILSESLELLLPTVGDAAQRVLFDVVGVLRESPGGGSSFSNTVKLLLDDRSQGVSFHAHRPSNSPRSPSAVDKHFLGTSGAIQTNTLTSLLALVTSANKHTSKFVRSQLSSSSLVRFLVAKLVAWQREYRATFTRRCVTLMQMVDAVVSASEHGGSPCSTEWIQPCVVQDVVKFAYSVPHELSVRAVGMLRITAAQCSGSSAERALWEVLRQCTKTCCGCSTVAGRLPISPRDATVALFAELVGAMILSGPDSTLAQVGSFVEANLLSCLAGETRVNLFLLTLVQRVIQDTGVGSDWRWSPMMPVVQLGVASLAASGSDRIRVLQLQVLRAVCSRVLVLSQQGSYSVSSRAASGRIEAAKTAKAAAKQQQQAADQMAQWRRLLGSERVQSDLRAILASAASAASSGERCSRAAVELARGLLALSARVQKLPQA